MVCGICRLCSFVTYYVFFLFCMFSWLLYLIVVLVPVPVLDDNLAGVFSSIGLVYNVLCYSNRSSLSRPKPMPTCKKYV